MKAEEASTLASLQQRIAVVEPATLHRSLHEEPHKVIGSNGMYIYRKDEAPVLDATGGAAVSCLGHRNERCVSISCIGRSNSIDKGIQSRSCDT